MARPLHRTACSCVLSSIRIGPRFPRVVGTAARNELSSEVQRSSGVEGSNAVLHICIRCRRPPARTVGGRVRVMLSAIFHVATGCCVAQLWQARQTVLHSTFGQRVRVLVVVHVAALLQVAQCRLPVTQPAMARSDPAAADTPAAARVNRSRGGVLRAHGAYALRTCVHLSVKESLVNFVCNAGKKGVTEHKRGHATCMLLPNRG